MTVDPLAPPSAPGLSDPQIDILVQRYELELARYEKTAALIAGSLERALREGAIPHLLSFRAKHPDGLREKLQRKRSKYDFETLRANLNAEITDLAGCRVVVYRPSDESVVASLVQEAFTLAPREDACKNHDHATGYCATHMLVTGPMTEEHRSTHGAVCEVQVCSLARHLFNEIEHDIVYKTPDGEPSKEERAALNKLLNNSKLAASFADDVFAAKAKNIERHASIENAEGLRFALEQRTGRSLRGEFGRLYLILAGTQNKVTSAALDALDPPEILKNGGLFASALALADADDVVQFVLGLWDDYRDEILLIASSWRGRKSVLARAIEKAKANSDGDANG